MSGLSDAAHAGIDFTNNLNVIIAENVIDDIGDILITDRPSIILTLRSKLSDKPFKLIHDGEDVEINMNKHVKPFSSYRMKKNLYTRSIQVDNLEVKLSVPTLKREYDINQAARDYLIKSSQQSNNNLETTLESVGEMYIYELVKYIDTVTFNNNTIEFNNLTFPQKTSICETFSLDISNKITKYMTDLREFETKFTNIVHNDENLEIPLSTILFTSD